MFLKKTADFNDPPLSLGPYLILTLPPPPSESVVFSPLSGDCLTRSNSISYYCGYFASSISSAHKECIFWVWRQFTSIVDLQPSSFFFAHSVFLNLSYSLKSLSSMCSLRSWPKSFCAILLTSHSSTYQHTLFIIPTLFTFIFMVCTFTVNQGEHVPGCYEPTWGCLNCTMMTTHKNITRQYPLTAPP